MHHRIKFNGNNIISNDKYERLHRDSAHNSLPNNPIEGILFGSRIGALSELDGFSVLNGFLFALTVFISLFSLGSKIDALDDVEALVVVIEVCDVDVSLTVLVVSSVLDRFSFSLLVVILLVFSSGSEIYTLEVSNTLEACDAGVS